MSFNLEYLWTRPGILKIVIVVLGIIAVSSGSEGYYDSAYTDVLQTIHKNETLSARFSDIPGIKKEIYFIVATFFCLTVSLLYLLALGIFPELTEMFLNRYIDTVYHIIASLLLFVAGFLMIYSAADIKANGCPRLQGLQGVDWGKLAKHSFLRNLYSDFLGIDDECQMVEEKLVGGIFGIINAVIYAITATVIFKTKEEDLP